MTTTSLSKLFKSNYNWAGENGLIEEWLSVLIDELTEIGYNAASQGYEIPTHEERLRRAIWAANREWDL